MTSEEQRQRNNQRAKAYAEAAKRLKQAHPQEFRDLLLAVYQEWGLNTRRKRTKDEIQQDAIAEAKRVLSEAAESGAIPAKDFNQYFTNAPA